MPPDIARVRYAKPPIVEAVINIRVRYPDGDLAEVLRAGEEAFASDFPRKQHLKIVGIEVKGEDVSSRLAKPLGIKFANESNNRIFQLREEGVAYSHLEPYESWESLRNEARPIWQKFVDTCRPSRVTRLAVKYINRLKFQPGVMRMEDSFNFYAETPESWGPVGAFVAQVHVALPEVSSRASGLVTVASENQADPTFHSIVLDIDLFENVDLAPEDPEVWHLLERMRQAKNRIFESSLQQVLKDKFK